MRSSSPTPSESGRSPFWSRYRILENKFQRSSRFIFALLTTHRLAKFQPEIKPKPRVLMPTCCSHKFVIGCMESSECEIVVTFLFTFKICLMDSEIIHDKKDSCVCRSFTILKYQSKGLFIDCSVDCWVTAGYFVQMVKFHLLLCTVHRIS